MPWRTIAILLAVALFLVAQGRWPNETAILVRGVNSPQYAAPPPPADEPAEPADNPEPQDTGSNRSSEGGGACRALPDKDGTVFDDASQISEDNAKYIHVQFWWGGNPERESLEEGGTYRIRQEIRDEEYGGTYWWFPESCTDDQVARITGGSPERRAADGADTAGRDQSAFDQMFEKVS